MSESFVVPARFRGPPRSGNGGWTSGHLAQLVALCLQPGLLAGQATLRVAAWTPGESAPELVWAALDCPGGWASGVADREMVLATMTASARELPVFGEPHVVMAWPSGAAGRKHYGGTCLYAAGGRLPRQTRCGSPSTPRRFARRRRSCPGKPIAGAHPGGLPL